MENFCNSYKGSSRGLRLTVLVLGVLHLAPKCAALTLSGSSSYASYPTWSGCPNASFSFEFSTTNTANALLWYVDGGTVDFFVVTIESNHVKLVLRTSKERDGSVEIVGSRVVTDGRWHRVEVRRRRMETFLDVDGAVKSNVTFGADFEFGGNTNTDVYIGGLPIDCLQRIFSYAVPSACTTTPRFTGKIRNVVYNNCTCLLERVSMLDGVGNTQGTEDRCERSNTCQQDFICISGDSATMRCNPSNLLCTAASVTYYELPMDEIIRQRLINPSGLDSQAYGSPTLLGGIRKRAVVLDGKDKYIKVSGPAHRFECFGDLDQCPSGYTLSVWVHFAKPGDATAYTFLSNGGHSAQNHGVAMTYSRRTLEVRFKRKNGDQWIVSSSDVLPQRWCHVAASWHPDQGLFLYINGELVNTVRSPTSGRPVNATNFNDFIIGRPNDVTQVSEVRQMMVDDFKFWSAFKSDREIRETGPFFRYYSSMDSREDIVNSNIRAQVRGSPGMVSGKIGNAMAFRSGGDCIDGGNLDETCLGNLTLCHYGITISMWIFFTNLRHDTFILSTGNQAIGIYYKDGTLKGEVWEGRNHWVTSWTGAETNRWYFLELSWLIDDWLRLYVDLQQIIEHESSETAAPPQRTGSNFYVARGHGNVQNAGAFIVDDLELWYGEREKLISTEFIARGRPEQHNITMDTIENNTLVHPSLQISLFGSPKITRGRIDGAVTLDGQDKYMSIGAQEANCLGNLDLCRHGFLLSAWLRLGRLREGMDILSSGGNGLQIRYVAGMVNIRARTSIHEWTLRTDSIFEGAWSFVEIGWDPYRGLSLYLDKDLVTWNSSSALRLDAVRTSHTAQQFYVGRGDGTESGASYGNLTIDDFEYWFGNREYLLAFGYLLRGRPQQYRIDMDMIQGGRIRHPDLSIIVFGNPTVVSGKINNAIRLTGSNQYLDLGEHDTVCLGYLEECTNGLTESIFLNFRSLQENTSYLSSGGGVRLFFSGQKLVVLLHEQRNQWKVEIPNLVTDRWYFLEYTWQRTKGLRVYLNNQFVGRQDFPTGVDGYPKVSNFLIGAGNVKDGPFNYADVLVDEVEVWYADRDQLVAFDYLLRDRVTYVVFPLDRLVHPDYTISTQGIARVVTGKVGNGVALSDDYVSFGDQRRNCMGNLKLCKHGLTVAFLFNPRQILSDPYVLSSASYSVFFTDNKLFVKFSLPKQTWELSTNRITTNGWNKLEISWDELRGFLLYVNGSLANSTFTYSNHSALWISDYNVYLGRPNKAANVIVDELEFWFANKDLLKAFDVVSDEITRFTINMDSIDNTASISFHGSPVTTNGIIGSGVALNGQEQFINMSGDVGCRGNLLNCLRGFTLRFKIKPNQLSENTYFVSSGILDVFYQNDRLVVEVHTDSRSWVASTRNFELGVWQQVEVSWHSVEGLKLYINTLEVDQKVVGTRVDRIDSAEQVFYVGRSHSGMEQKLYASAVLDDFQFFEGRRELLIPDLINPGRDLELILAAYPTTVSVIPTTIRAFTVTPGVRPTTKKWLVFDGHALFRFNFSFRSDYYRWRDISSQSVQLTFRTTSPEGILWFTGNGSYFFTLGLKDGKIKLVLNRTVSTSGGSRIYEEVFIPGQSRQLNDNAWHRIVFTQNRDGQVKVVIDDQEFSKKFAAYVDVVNADNFYFGGISDISQQSHFSGNFNGTISEMMIFDGTRENVLDLEQITVTDPLPSYVYQGGNVVYQSPDPPDPQPVTFTTERSYVRVPVIVSEEISVEVRFRTFEPNSLILYIEGADGSLSLELFEGLLYLNLGSIRYSFNKPSRPLNDGQLHLVKFSLGQRNFLLDLDGVTSTFGSGSASQIRGLKPFMFIGGIGDGTRVPQNIWSYDRPFFRGCLSGVRINGGRMVVLEQYIEGQVGLEVGCPDFRSRCAQLPCVHGVCSERSVGRYCDCSATEFTGRDCGTSAQFVGFSGEDYLRFFISQSNTTQTNDVSLRFKGLQENSFLFSLSNKQTGQFLRAEMYDGNNVKIETNIGGNKTLLLRCSRLNDNQWHTIRLKRRPSYLQAFVDNCADSNTLGSSDGSSYSFAVTEILIGRSGQRDDGFVGYLQNFNVDEYQFFEIFKVGSSDQIPGLTINSTVRLTSEETDLFAFPVTFTRQAYTNVVTQTEMRVRENRTLRLVLKTSEQDGLMIYNRGFLRDHFFAVELVGGILQVSANDGGVAQVVKATGAQLSDGGWHAVDIRETAPKQFAIVVDRNRSFVLRFPSTQNSLDLLGTFHVGGAPDSVLERLPAAVKSRKGFTGCLATLIIDGKLIDMSKVPGDQGDQSPYVFKGCISDTTKFCLVHPCRNGGLCIDEGDSFRCDCRLTSFVGRYCSAEAEGYQFGLEGASGLVVFNMTLLQSVVNDAALALGFQTWSENGTLLFLRSTSSSSSGSSSQFFEIRLVNGFVSIRYDFGSGIQELVERGRKFNDGEYHHLSFQKVGSNFQLQVDDMAVQRYNLQGSSSEFFRSLYLVHLGARGTDAKGIIVNPFSGIISGVYVNGYEVTDLGVNQRDGRVNVFGDTGIASHPFFVAKTRPEVSPTKIAVIDGGGGGVGWVSESSIIDEIVLVPGAEGGDALAQFQDGAGYSRAEEGGRAAAISGAMLALLAVVSSMMWAVYRCKPGIVGKVSVDFNSGTGAGTSMLHTARKSLSSAGADDVTVSQSTPGYESWNAGRPSRTSISHEMALFATSGSQASTRMNVESSGREVKSGGYMETAGFGQGASQLTAGRNVSTQIIVERSSAGGIGGTGHGQDMSQITMSSHKASTQMGGSVGHSGLAQDMTLNSDYRNFGGAGQDMSQFTSGQNVSTQMVYQSGSAGNFGGTGLGHELSQVTTSSRKGSTQIIVETSTTSGKTDLGQEMSYVSMDRNMSSQIVHGSGSTGSLGRNLLSQDISQVTTSSRKGSTQMLFDANSDGYAGGTSIQERSQVTAFSQKGNLLGQDISQVTTSNRKGSTQLLFDANSDGYAGGTSIQERSQVTAFSQKGSAPMIVDANSGGYTGGNSIQERSQVTTFSQKGSNQLIVGANSDGYTGGTSIQERSQVTTFSRKGSSQMIVETSTVGATGRGQEVSSTATSGYNSSTQMVDASKSSMSQVPSVTFSVAGHGAALAQGMDIDAKSAERKEETIHLSGKKRLDGRNLSPTEPHATTTMSSVENSASSIQGQGFKASEIRVQDRGGGFTVNTSSTITTTEHIDFGLSSDRKVPLIKGQPPKTLKLESSAREGGGGGSQPDMIDLKVNVSLERSNSSVRGQPPKTLNLGSPTVQPGGIDSPLSGDLRAPPRSLERSSSFVQGQQPKTLKIESPGGVTSPTVWSATTGSPFSPRDQKSSAFTETRQLTGRAIRSETFTTSSQGVPVNPQLPNLSMTSRTYQMRNVPLNVSQEELYKYKIPSGVSGGVPHWQLQSALAGLNEPTRVTAGPPQMTSEMSDRVECILLTTNGQCLITGSIYGPPQVWDMKTGECVKKMEGDNISSTDLHLASNDTLLIGQVAEVQPLKPNAVPEGQNYKRLQIWDFDSGRCLKMRNNELYTASFLMSDGDHVILSRRESAVGGTSSSIIIIVWDILGNQPDRRISYSLERNVPADHITYISQTPDKRFVIAGFRNPKNGNATYLAFDLTVSNFDVVPPTMIELPADVQVTVIVENHEAVTGTKSGALVVWSLRTGKQQRQLVAPSTEVTGGRAHQMDVKDLVVSKDGQHLVSASADCTLRLWNLESGKHLRTFTGHTDKVSCCAISNDNELVVSGSRDQTIRLWRLDNGNLVTSIFISADVYRVLLSNDKKTIAALADQNGERKMVMLQVVRTKTKRRMGSHGESPQSPDSPFTPSFQLTPETG